jgi:YHS domain-containing protein
MFRVVLLLVLSIIISRMFWRIVGSFREGISGGGAGQPPRVPQHGVPMVRDPICGTFLLPERAAATLVDGRSRQYFCSTACRDKYRARPEARESARGRTA